MCIVIAIIFTAITRRNCYEKIKRAGRHAHKDVDIFVVLCGTFVCVCVSVILIICLKETVEHEVSGLAR